ERMIVRKVLGPEAAEEDLAAAFQRAQETARVEILIQPPLPPALSAKASASNPSDLPLILVGTVVRDDTARSVAIIRVLNALVVRNFHPGEEVLDGAVLEHVERTHVVLRRGNLLQSLPLASASTSRPTPAPEHTPLRTMPPPDVVTDLRREDVD